MTNPHYNTYVVHADRTTEKTGNDNGRVDYDTLDLIAEAWLEANPGSRMLLAGEIAPAVKLDGVYEVKRQLVQDWLMAENKLRTMSGTDVQGRPFTLALIHPGMTLVLPDGNAIDTPKQAYIEPQL